MAGEGRRELRPFVEEFQIASEKSVIVLGDGRLINLAAAEGHPASVMDMSFANQALACSYLAENRTELDHRVYDVPKEIDHEIARLKLASMQIEIDVLTDEQSHYLDSWEHGTYQSHRQSSKELWQKESPEYVVICYRQAHAFHIGIGDRGAPR